MIKKGERLKRFVVFSSPDYYPGGGSNDVSGSFETIIEAMAHCRSESVNWMDNEIFDCHRRIFLGPDGKP